jgi:hypothetical protein
MSACNPVGLGNTRVHRKLIMGKKLKINKCGGS